MIRRETIRKWASTDEPCPEFTGSSDVYKVVNGAGEFILVLDWTDVFELWGHEWPALPGWRDRYSWASDDGVAGTLFECLAGVLVGKPVKEALYCLPWDAVRDSNAMLEDLAAEYPDGIPLEPNVYGTPTSPYGLAVRVAVDEICDVFQPRSGREPEEFPKPVRVRWDI